MLILGFESSCDETGVALVRTAAPSSVQPGTGHPGNGLIVPRLVAHALHS